jgi:integrase
MRLFVTIALYTTARTSAILELTWDRVDFTKGEIRFSTGEQSVTNITDKGFQKGRATVHMTDTLRAVLSHARDSATSRYVIAYRGRGGLGSIMTGWQAARERAGLGPDVTPHVLRHTGATWLANEGVPVESVSKLLGHAKIDTTRLYQHSDSSPTKQAAEALERGAQKGLRVVK